MIMGACSIKPRRAATARQGGDSLGGRALPSCPRARWLSRISWRCAAGATIALDIPDFNGTLRLMAVAWSDSALGQDAEQIIVRDPVVAELILPRFLAPGDEAQGALNIDNVEGPPGAYVVTISGSDTAQIQTEPRRFNLNRGQRQTALIPITGGPLGVGRIRLQLEGPQGFAAISRTYDMQTRAPYLPITITETAPLNAGASWRAPANALSRFRADGQALISFSNLAGIDPAPLLDELYRYPYGCTEQLISVAMPCYYNVLASNLAARPIRASRRIRKRPRKSSIGNRRMVRSGFGARVMAMQRHGLAPMRSISCSVRNAPASRAAPSAGSGL